MNEEDNENADDLQFGEGINSYKDYWLIIDYYTNDNYYLLEFDDDVHCLTNDEIYLLLLRKQTVDNQSDTFLQTLSYAETVATTPIEVSLLELAYY